MPALHTVLNVLWLSCITLWHALGLPGAPSLVAWVPFAPSTLRVPPAPSILNPSCDALFDTPNYHDPIRLIYEPVEGYQFPPSGSSINLCAKQPSNNNFDASGYCYDAFLHACGTRKARSDLSVASAAADFLKTALGDDTFQWFHSLPTYQRRLVIILMLSFVTSWVYNILLLKELKGADATRDFYQNPLDEDVPSDTEVDDDTLSYTTVIEDPSLDKTFEDNDCSPTTLLPSLIPRSEDEDTFISRSDSLKEQFLKECERREDKLDDLSDLELPNNSRFQRLPAWLHSRNERLPAVPRLFPTDIPNIQPDSKELDRLDEEIILRFEEPEEDIDSDSLDDHYDFSPGTPLYLHQRLQTLTRQHYHNAALERYGSKALEARNLAVNLTSRPSTPNAIDRLMHMMGEEEQYHTPSPR